MFLIAGTGGFMALQRGTGKVFDKEGRFTLLYYLLEPGPLTAGIMPRIF